MAQRPGLRVQGLSVANAQGRGREGGWDPAAKGPGLSAEESGLHPTARACHVLRSFQVGRRDMVTFEKK